MTGLSAIDGAPARASDPGSARHGLRTAQEAARRAGAYAAPDDARTQAAIQRLHRLLTSGEPPQRDAPRGYHLDITI
jgi:hypothetical protein